MQIQGKLTAEELKDVGNLVRSRWYWPKLLLRSFYGVVLVVALVGATVAKIIARDWSHWEGLAGFWLIVAIVLGGSTYSVRRSSRKELAELNASLADTIILNDSGISTRKTNGATSSQPWGAFRGWRNGKIVALVDIADARGFVMLPLSGLNVVEQEQVRHTLTAYLGQATNWKKQT